MAQYESPLEQFFATLPNTLLGAWQAKSNNDFRNRQLQMQRDQNIALNKYRDKQLATTISEGEKNRENALAIHGKTPLDIAQQRANLKKITNQNEAYETGKRRDNLFNTLNSNVLNNNDYWESNDWTGISKGSLINDALNEMKNISNDDRGYLYNKMYGDQAFTDYYTKQSGREKQEFERKFYQLRNSFNPEHPDENAAYMSQYVLNNTGNNLQRTKEILDDLGYDFVRNPNSILDSYYPLQFDANGNPTNLYDKPSVFTKIGRAIIPQLSDEEALQIAKDRIKYKMYKNEDEELFDKYIVNSPYYKQHYGNKEYKIIKKPLTFTIDPNKTYFGKKAEEIVANKANRDLNDIEKYVLGWEGYRQNPYKDIYGVNTSGAGQTGIYRNMSFVDAVADKEKAVKKIFPDYEKYPLGIKQVLVSSMYRGDFYNKGKLQKWVQEVKNGNFKEAAKLIKINKEYNESKKKKTSIYKRIDAVADTLNKYDGKIK